MKTFLFGMCLAVSSASLLPAQTPALTASKSDPAPGETVTIKVNVDPGKHTKLSWTNTGDGQFLTETQNQTKVQFRPNKAGATITITCQIDTPNGEQHPSITLTVSGSSAPPAQPDAASHDTRSNAPTNTEKVHEAAPAPAGDLTLDKMDYMVPAGFMGDAMSENGEAAKLDVGFTGGCHVDPSCIRIEYQPADGRVGWAAFAWQRVTEGSANWGESPGADYSRGGYLSLRVFAKGQPNDAGNLPKVQFKSGGNVAPTYNSTNRASYVVAGPTLQLTAAWVDYCVSLENRDLSNTVSPFTVVVTKTGNPKGAVLFLDHVRFSQQRCSN
jgi:hypothetical protein